jgi:hypothetical protein
MVAMAARLIKASKTNAECKIRFATLSDIPLSAKAAD